MATTKELTALVETLTAQVATLTAQSAPRKARAKAPTISQRRDTDARVCTAHKAGCGKNKDGHFATPNGQVYHEARGGQF